MKVRKTSVLKSLASAATVLALIAAGSFVLLRGTPARATAPYFYLDMGQTGTATPQNITQNSTVDFTATVLDDAGDTVTSATTVYMEVRGGSNDVDDGSGPNSDGISYETPDAQCVIPTGQSLCDINYTFTTPTSTNTSSSILFWIKGRVVDDGENQTASSTQGETFPTKNYGCVDGTPAGDTHSDGTAVKTFVVVNSTSGGGATLGPNPENHYTGGAPNPAPVCSTDANPPMTDDRIAGGGPTGTPTPTNTGTATGSPSPTATSTPTDTGSPSPTPTSTDTGTATPTPTNTNTGGGGPGAVTLEVSPHEGVYGTDFLVSGNVSCGGVKVSGAKVKIIRQTVASPHAVEIDTTTDSQGRYAMRDTDLAASSDYSASWAGNSSCTAGAETGANKIRAKVDPGVPAAAKSSSLKKGQTATISGKVIPAHPSKKVSLNIYRGDQKKWDWVTDVKLDKNSAYVFTYKAGSYKGQLLFRVAYMTQDQDHGWNISRNVFITWS